MIERFIEQRIKDAADIKDVVGEFCALKSIKTEYTCACPIHNGQHLNHFKVNTKKNIFHCFVCGAGGGPIDFLMQYPGTRFSYPDALRWLAQRYGIDTGEGEQQRRFTFHTTAEKRDAPSEPEPEKTMVELPLNYVTALRDTTDDNFCRWVRSLPWNEEQRARVERILEAYLVGHSKHLRATIFWQVDDEGRVRTGKIMGFYPPGHPRFGHRDKARTPNWVTAKLTQQGIINEETQEVRRCLFGLHLVNAQGVGSMTANIVESEKTAVIMAIALGGRNGLWMATGGMQFLKKEYIDHLLSLGYSVVLHPDHDGDGLWRKKMAEFGFVIGRDYLVSNQYVTAYWTEADGPKADAADIIVRRLWEHDAGKYNKTVEEFCTKCPPLKQLITTFNLKAIKAENETQPTT